VIDPTPSTPAEVLRSAADYITQHGRIRGKLMVRPHRRVPIGCAIGTCQIVTNFNFELSRVAIDAAVRLLPANAPEWSIVTPGLLSNNRLAQFNDDITTTDADVVELFIQAAEKLEAGL
jgi:hypothetical protein